MALMTFIRCLSYGGPTTCGGNPSNRPFSLPVRTNPFSSSAFRQLRAGLNAFGHGVNHFLMAEFRRKAPGKPPLHNISAAVQFTGNGQDGSERCSRPGFIDIYGPALQSFVR